MGTPSPSVSIVIRARNEAALIRQALEKIQAQDYSGPVGVLVIDSGSTDRTVEIAKSFDQVTVSQIPPTEFNYGGTLNSGISETRGEFVVCLSAHCVPLGPGWLRALVAPIAADSQTAGTFGRQVPWPEADLIEATWLENTFGGEDRLYEGVAGYERAIDVLFSNANSCIRRSVAEQFPFQRLAWAEDRIWGYEVLRAGYRLRYAAQAAVYHSHQRSVMGYFKVGRSDGRAYRQMNIPVARISKRQLFGPLSLYNRFRGWYHRTRPIHGRITGAGSAVALCCKEILSDIGRSAGARGW